MTAGLLGPFVRFVHLKIVYVRLKKNLWPLRPRFIYYCRDEVDFVHTVINESPLEV